MRCCVVFVRMLLVSESEHMWLASLTRGGFESYQTVYVSCRKIIFYLSGKEMDVLVADEQLKSTSLVVLTFPGH